MREILTSVKRTPYQSLASFLILFFTLFLSLFFFTLTSFFNGVLSYVETKPQVTVYFDTKTKESDIIAVQKTLAESGKVSSVEYTSQQEALKIYKDLNKDNPLLLEMVSADILPASLGIYAKEPEFLAQIAEFLKKQPNVDDVEFQKQIVDKLLSLTMIMRRGSLVIFSTLIFISFVVLMTTAAFKIALKKDEIELLQLLGANKRYIRRPFIQEGLLFGFSAATIAFLLFYAVFFYFKPFLNSYLHGISKLPFYGLGSFDLYVWPPSLPFIGLSYLVIFFFGILIGFFGIYFATTKYIK